MFVGLVGCRSGREELVSMLDDSCCDVFARRELEVLDPGGGWSEVWVRLGCWEWVDVG